MGDVDLKVVLMSFNVINREMVINDENNYLGLYNNRTLFGATEPFWEHFLCLSGPILL